ncbi:26523_t:CDS:2, partial [Gigaspora margarita]
MQAEEYIGNKKNDKEQIKVWTDRCCQNNRKTNTKASISIYFNDSKKISERLLDLVYRINDLIKEHNNNIKFIYVKSYSGNKEN